MRRTKRRTLGEGSDVPSLIESEQNSQVSPSKEIPPAQHRILRPPPGPRIRWPPDACIPALSLGRLAGARRVRDRCAGEGAHERRTAGHRGGRARAGGPRRDADNDRCPGRRGRTRDLRFPRAGASFKATPLRLIRPLERGSARWRPGVAGRGGLAPEVPMIHNDPRSPPCPRSVPSTAS